MPQGYQSGGLLREQDLVLSILGGISNAEPERSIDSNDMIQELDQFGTLLKAIKLQLDFRYMKRF